MSTKIKNLFLVILSCLMVFSMSLVALGSVIVKATTVNPDTFTMVQGAQLRLKTDYNGIRFQAKIGTNVAESVANEDGAYFGMIVVPVGYFETFENELVAGNNDYVTVLGAELGKLGYTLWNRTNIEPYDGIADQNQDTNYKYINAVVSDILYANFNVQRVGIAYYYNSTGYHYADGFMNGEEYVSRSVSDLTVSALKDKVTPYTDTQLEVLNTFKYLADSSKNGVSEKNATENIEAYVDYCKNTELTGNQVANFDRAGSDVAFMAMTGNKNNAPATTEYLDSFEGANGVLKFTVDGSDGKSNYGGKQIKFAKGVTVTAGTVVSFKYYLDNKVWMRVKGAGKEFTSDVAFNSSLTGKWLTRSIKATSLGYAVGEYMDGIEVFANNSSCYIDEITVTNDANEDLTKYLYTDTNGNGEAANFDNYLYALNGDGVNYIEDGETKSLVVGIDSGVSKTVKLIRSFVVSADDKLVIRVKSPVAKFRMNNTSGNSAGVSEKTYADYTELTFDVVKDLGYSLGDTLSSIAFKNQGQNCNGEVYIDYIKVTNSIENVAKELTGNQIANYDIDAYSTLIPNINNAVYRSELVSGAWKFTTFASESTNDCYNRYELKFAPSSVEGEDYYAYKTVPADDANVEGYLAIKIKTSSNKIVVTTEKYINSTSSQYFLSLFSSNAGDWTYVKTGDWQIAIVPVKALGFEAGQDVNKILFSHWGNVAETYIDWIEYVELDKGLNKQQSFNAYVKENNNVLIDFDDKSIDYSSQIKKYSATWDSSLPNSADVNTWNYWSKNTSSQVVYYGDSGYNVGPDVEGNGVLKVAPGGQNYGGFGIIFDRAIYVTDSTKITFRVYNTSGQSFRLAKIGDTKTAGKQVSGITAGGAWSDVTVKLTDIGYNVDDFCVGVEIYFYGSNLYIDSITLA